MEGKNLFVLLSGALLGALLFSACTGNPAGPGQASATSSTSPGTTYTGFMEAEPGQWVEYDISTSSGSIRQRMEYIGTDSIDGVSANVFEMKSGNGLDSMGSFQVWVDSSTQKIVKYAGKFQDKVLCLDVKSFSADVPSPGGDKTPAGYGPTAASSYGYTTPTGKTVPIVKHITEDVEVWVSSEMPFGIVKTVDLKTGKDIMSVYDYGLSGAKRTITKQELQSCETVGA